MVAAEPTLSRRRRPVNSQRTAIRGVISSTPDRASVIALVESSRKLALSYLIKKSRSNSLSVAAFGLSIEDLALDCIAELFERDSEGAFPVMQTYFGERIADDATEADLKIALRRLVFSKVNENLFRRYHETDTNLSKIIRNLKDAAKVDDRLDIAKHKGEKWIVVSVEADASNEDRLFGPLAPIEILESFFTSELHEHPLVRDLARRLVAFVDHYPQYANGYPIVAAALALRSAYVRTEAVGDDESITTPSRSTMDIEDAIGDVTQAVFSEKKASYVGRGKVDETVYNAYNQTVEDILSAQLLPDVAVHSYQDILARNLKDLDDDEYQDNHRNILEYLAKVARQELYEYLYA